MFQTAFQPNAFQNDAFQIVINPIGPTKNGGDDAWTHGERKRYKALQKKLRLAEEKRIEALKLDAEKRKQVMVKTIRKEGKGKTKRWKIQVLSPNSLFTEDLVFNTKNKELTRIGVFPQPNTVLKKSRKK